MTKDEIKKALECCETDWCCVCPYYKYAGCETILKKDVLTLITEQEKEIERLKSNNGFLQCVISHSKDMMDEAVKQAQIDVLNELKVRHDYANMTMGYPWDISQQIDELIKEVE